MTRLAPATSTSSWTREPGRRRDHLFVERARLIAIDGEVIAAAPWSTPAPVSRFLWSSHWPEDSAGLPPDGLFIAEPE